METFYELSVNNKTFVVMLDIVFEGAVAGVVLQQVGEILICLSGSVDSHHLTLGSVSLKARSECKAANSSKSVDSNFYTAHIIKILSDFDKFLLLNQTRYGQN